MSAVALSLGMKREEAMSTTPVEPDPKKPPKDDPDPNRRPYDEGH
jgi:hypothetical protein